MRVQGSLEAWGYSNDTERIVPEAPEEKEERRREDEAAQEIYDALRAEGRSEKDAILEMLRRNEILPREIPG